MNYSFRPLVTPRGWPFCNFCRKEATACCKWLKSSIWSRALFPTISSVFLVVASFKRNERERSAFIHSIVPSRKNFFRSSMITFTNSKMSLWRAEFYRGGISVVETIRISKRCHPCGGICVGVLHRTTPRGVFGGSDITGEHSIFFTVVASCFFGDCAGGPDNLLLFYICP